MITRKRLVKDASGRRIVANIELREAESGERLVGGLSPAWSITGEVWEPHGSRSGATRQRHYERNNGDVGPASEPDMCGCVHDEILAAFPQLAPIVALHWSDPDGTPIYSFENGWYWVGGQAMAYEAKDALRDRTATLDDIYDGGGSYSLTYIEKYETKAARLWRCDISDLPSDPGGMRGGDEHRKTVERFVDAQRDRWRAESDVARALLETLPDA